MVDSKSTKEIMNLIRLQLSTLRNEDLEIQNIINHLEDFDLNEDGEVCEKGIW